MGLIGHSANDAGLRQGLEEHLQQVATLASEFASEFGCASLGWLAGILHDCGKASCAFQAGIIRAEHTGQRVGVDHKRLGCVIAIERGLHDLSLVLHGHHGGLTSRRTVRRALKNLSPSDVQAHTEARERLRSVLDDMAAIDVNDLPWTEALDREMGVRFLFSALCDADSLDTAAHFQGKKAATPPIRADFSALWKRYESRRADLFTSRESTPRPLDAARADVYEACVAAAEKPPGIYRLSVGTGLGKTISGGAFAVKHAAQFDKRRVIVALPWKTITEQNADVYRSLLDHDEERVVLEHHSGVDFDAGHGGRWARLASENWDAPFIVTTTVRLFEALLGRGREATRRVHNIANSVVVIDEVQGLPARLLVPILDALRSLVNNFNVTVLLCSATQPEFWALPPFRKLAAHDIEPTATSLDLVEARVEYQWRLDSDIGLADIAAEAATRSSALVIVNTTGDANTIAAEWNAHGQPGSFFHLSGHMCGHHRNHVLGIIRRRLNEGLPTFVVATQLIEAGVDIDFPWVYRALAGAESIAQAAGRCNREALMATPGTVVIFTARDASAPPDYRVPIEQTQIYFGPDRSQPGDRRAMMTYWKQIYKRIDVNGPTSRGTAIQRSRSELDFESVTKGRMNNVVLDERDPRTAFRMIDNDSVGVVIPQWHDDDALQEHQRVSESGNPTVQRLIERLMRGEAVGESLRALQPYLTNIHISTASKPEVRALMGEVLGELGQPGSIAVWRGDYSYLTGMNVHPSAEEHIF